VRKSKRVKGSRRNHKRAVEANESCENIENLETKTRRSKYPLDCPRCFTLLRDRKAKVSSLTSLFSVLLRSVVMEIFVNIL
jgi:uncharacterized paraquat-inducible protein A